MHSRSAFLTVPFPRAYLQYQDSPTEIWTYPSFENIHSHRKHRPASLGNNCFSATRMRNKTENVYCTLTSSEKKRTKIRLETRILFLSQEKITPLTNLLVTLLHTKQEGTYLTTYLFSTIWKLWVVAPGLWISLAFETRNNSMANSISTSDT